MHSKQTCSTQAKPDFDENCDSLLLSPLNIRSNRWYLIEQNLNLTCRIRSNSNSNFKRPYLGNEMTNLISAGAKILLSSRAFTYSFMKVASRHSFTLFRPLSVRKTTFSGCSRCVSLCVIGQNMPPGPLSM